VELRPDPSATATRVLAIDGDLLVAVVDVPEDRPDRASVDVLAAERVGPAEARGIVDGLVDAGSRVHGSSLAVRVSDPLVRYALRRAGFSGPLRAPLARAGLLRAAPADPPVARPSDRDDLASEVGALVPGASVRRRGGFRRGYEIVATATDRPVAIRVRLPRRDDLMPEPIAAAIDTALGVKARFGRPASGIVGLSFDHGGDALSTGDVAGLAEGASGVVVLTPNFVCADLLADQRVARASAGHHRGAPADDRPFAVVDAVIAHECWHYLDAEVRVSGAAYVEFNAALGEALGVDSLEQALRGREHDAPPAWVVAHDRRVCDVSAYAATSPREATAEMFSAWWCATGPASPVIARFGELVERYFPR
jgi:hypothetical protein